MKEFRKRKSRAWLKPRTPLPLAVRAVGQCVWPPNTVIERSSGEFIRVFWGVRGAGVFRSHNKSAALRADQILVFPADHEHELRVDDEALEYRWWTIDGHFARETVMAFGFEYFEPRDVGPPPEALFERLVDLLDNVSVAAEQEASTVAYALLVAASTPTKAQRQSDPLTGDPLIDRCVRIMQDEYARSDLSIEGIAERLGVHRSVLSRRFRADHGIEPIQYLKALRMQRALVLLDETDLPIGEIARMTGFNHLSYFSLAVRKATGASPREFRKT